MIWWSITSIPFYFSCMVFYLNSMLKEQLQWSIKCNIQVYTCIQRDGGSIKILSKGSWTKISLWLNSDSSSARKMQIKSLSDHWMISWDLFNMLFYDILHNVIKTLNLVFDQLFPEIVVNGILILVNHLTLILKGSWNLHNFNLFFKVRVSCLLYEVVNWVPSPLLHFTIPIFPHYCYSYKRDDDDDKLNILIVLEKIKSNIVMT